MSATSKPASSRRDDVTELGSTVTGEGVAQTRRLAQSATKGTAPRYLVGGYRRGSAAALAPTPGVSDEFHLDGAPDSAAADRQTPRRGLFAASAFGVTGLLVGLYFAIPDGQSQSLETVAYRPKLAAAAANNFAADDLPSVEKTAASQSSPSRRRVTLGEPRKRKTTPATAQAQTPAPTQSAAVENPATAPAAGPAAPAATAAGGAAVDAAPAATEAVQQPAVEPTQPAAPTEAAATTAAASQAPVAAASATTTSAVRPAVTLDGRTMGGWYGGAGGFGVANGSFGNWLGQSVTVAGVWADSGDVEQRTVSGLSGYENWNGAIDIATGGLVNGENFYAAANGAYDDRWRASAQKIASVRAGKGPTFVRPFHEFNGDWFAWSINSGNVSAYKQAYARYAGIMRAALPEVYMVWSPNYGDKSGLPVDSYYPGNDVVDVIAPDFYSDFDVDNGVAEASYGAWLAKQSAWRGSSPIGVEAWRQYAAGKGKAFALPEWGLKPNGRSTDLPQWIKNVNTWATEHANTATWSLGAAPSGAAGKVLYTSYFNVNHDGPGNTVYGYGANPNAAEVYRNSRWGNIG